MIKKITGTDNKQTERTSSEGKEITREQKRLGISAGNNE